ncbi:hypothetical protein PPYR_13476 [Photinus pyralis]|uniref:Uncharacterized protein n=2 Tax=Photinus pyralis TaxID=7054 RepID=A0A5N4A947_PHOPY|nr:uncharacterized protein LOC116178494 [Photinus pyralis]KAB0793856.1 hypothetical protein PPYR_13476 [Photinus pyralis]
MGDDRIDAQEKGESQNPTDNNLTISTKLSTDHLICKTPQESPNVSVKSLPRDGEVKKVDGDGDIILYLGVSQIVFGLLMAVFGALVLVHDARLARLGGGLWGGGLAVTSGTAGVLAAARSWCPLRRSAQKIAQTVFLALSLILVAVSQLVVVFAATGLARDINRTLDNELDVQNTEALQANEISTANYLALMSNAGLLIVSGVQFVCATMASYKSSRMLCPCFKSSSEMSAKTLQVENKHAFIDSWLGKHTYPPPLYVVTSTPTSTGKRSKLSVAPVLSIPSPPPPPMLGYPLIPAPLGAIPSPHIHPYPKPHRKHPKRYHSMIDHSRQIPTPIRKPRRYKSKTKEKPITTEDVVRTYTGLDRTIAEEFIEICDSRNNSLCSESSCQSSCHSSGCTCGNITTSSAN